MADLLARRAALIECLALKALPRAGWRRAGLADGESVAGHSWGVAWLVLALAPPQLDRGRALAMAVIHDLAEVRTGDVTPHDGVAPAAKAAAERAALAALVAPLPGAAELCALQASYQAGDCAEARFVRACDKLEMALQAAAYADRIDPGEFLRSALAQLEDPALRALAGGDAHSGGEAGQVT